MQSGRKRTGLNKFGLYRSIRRRVMKLFKTVEIDGVYVCVDSHARQYMGEGLYRGILNGNYESDERELLRVAVRSGDKVLEIGACLGLTGMLAARIVGEENVLCYEANPEVEWLIRKNYELNKHKK